MEITNENIVSVFKSSAKTQVAFCRDNGINVEKLRYYLYKKNKSATKISLPARQKSNTATPAFITFNRSTSTVPVSSQPSKHNVTIIRGQFTISEIAALFSMQDQI